MSPYKEDFDILKSGKILIGVKVKVDTGYIYLLRLEVEESVVGEFKCYEL